MRTYLAWAIWLIAFIFPLRMAILNTVEIMHEDGSGPKNLLGLAYFVVGLTLVFVGYWLKDSTAGPKADSAQGH